MAESGQYTAVEAVSRGTRRGVSRRMAKIVRSSVGLLCLVGASWAYAEPTAAVRLVAEPAEVSAGEDVAVVVMIDADAPVNLADLVLEYDSGVLRLDVVDASRSAFTFAAVDERDPEAGTVRLIRGEPHPHAPSGPNLQFCRLIFRAVEAAATTEVGVRFSREGAAGDSAVYRDDGVPSDVLRSVSSASIHVADPEPIRPPREHVGRGH